MTEPFSFDVFLSYSSKDKAEVESIAERLRTDGLRVWFDDWVLQVGDNILATIEEGLEQSRVLVLCMSANAFGSDWAPMESGTFRFRDPQNKQRRFIPLLLDKSPVKGALAQFLYVDWEISKREQSYAKLLAACRPSEPSAAVDTRTVGNQVPEGVIELPITFPIYSFAVNKTASLALAGASDPTDTRLQILDVVTGRGVRQLLGQDSAVRSIAWSHDSRYALTGSVDPKLRLWEIDTGRLVRSFEGHSSFVWAIEWNADGQRALSGGHDGMLMLWDVHKGVCLGVFELTGTSIVAVTWSKDSRYAVAGCSDSKIQMWDVQSQRLWRTFEGHDGYVWSVECSANGRRMLSGASDATVRLWETETGRCLRILEGHTSRVTAVSWNPGGNHALSGSDDKTLRLWDLETGLCLRVLQGHEDPIRSLVWSGDGRRAFSGDARGSVCIWDLSEFISASKSPKVTMPGVSLAADQVQYTNAKVLLVGESGAGKTGLSKVLSGEPWQASDSTVGAWATQWKLPVVSDSINAPANSSGVHVEREIWLWDFGGQADQRLIHQLYMDETALAVLVFDGQKEDLFETLGQWDRDLTRATRKEFAKLLVAGRVDAGGLRVSRSELDKFAAERKFRAFLETSAKKNVGCDELKDAILNSINWDEIPCRTTEVLFKRLKEEIIRLKDAGRVLMRFNELRETLQLRLSGEITRFTDEELHAVLTLLAGPCVVWELAFGSWVLLQPERINAYAQAVIRTLQEDEHQRGCLMEERVLNGELAYESSMERLVGEEERFVLLAMHQTLVERGLCLRQPTPKGNLLVFPSYYRRERPEQVKFPAVLVSYRFTGFLDDIYATLIVRLHHTDSFQQDELWRYAADFKTNTGKQLGIKLTRKAPGLGELEVYFDPAVSIEERIIFSKYVHEHLLQHAGVVERLRHYVCSECGTPVGNREVAMQRLSDWLHDRPSAPAARTGFSFLKAREKTPSIICVVCEKRVALWDEMEQSFASPEIQRRVRDMREESAIVLDNESRERVLVGEVISTVALAGQICREFNLSDHGIDMEIEFKDDAHKATGVKLYLQLKLEDSYKIELLPDASFIFTVKDERQAHYWIAQLFPVLLVVRTTNGEVHWMEIRESLKRSNTDAEKQIVFDGERFDVMSVRRWRDRCLGERNSG